MTIVNPWPLEDCARMCVRVFAYAYARSCFSLCVCVLARLEARLVGVKVARKLRSPGNGARMKELEELGEA